jgi:hypothetical protein
MTLKHPLLWLLALLGGTLTLGGCSILNGDDDDSASDDDDSASDDDDSVSDDDDSTAATTCDDLQASYEACALVGGWDAGTVDMCTAYDLIDVADQDAWLGCAEGALLDLDCSGVSSSDEAFDAIGRYMLETAGCEDFGPETPPMELDAIEISCSAEAGPGNVHSAWNVELNVTPGWIASDSLELFLWDGNTFDATWANDVHYVDAWLPLTDWTNDESGDFSSYDTWSTDFMGYSTLGDAQTNDGTFLKCVDSNGVPQIENRDFMVCATDFTYPDVTECWFCGNYYGEAAGTNSVDHGTVGSYEDGTDTWDSTQEFTDTASAEYPCYYTVL